MNGDDSHELRIDYNVVTLGVSEQDLRFAFAFYSYLYNFRKTNLKLSCLIVIYP